MEVPEAWGLNQAQIQMVKTFSDRNGLFLAQKNRDPSCRRFTRVHLVVAGNCDPMQQRDITGELARRKISLDFGVLCLSDPFVFDKFKALDLPKKHISSRILTERVTSMNAATFTGAWDAARAAEAVESNDQQMRYRAYDRIEALMHPRAAVAAVSSLGTDLQKSLNKDRGHALLTFLRSCCDSDTSNYVFTPLTFESTGEIRHQDALMDDVIKFKHNDIEYEASKWAYMPFETSHGTSFVKEVLLKNRDSEIVKDHIKSDAFLAAPLKEHGCAVVDNLEVFWPPWKREGSKKRMKVLLGLTNRKCWTLKNSETDDDLYDSFVGVLSETTRPS